MAKDLKKYIGVKIQAARQSTGLTQEELAGRIEKSPETISNIERGHVLTSVETLYEITKALNIPFESLSEGFAGSQAISRERLLAEQKLTSLIRTLSDKNLRLVTAIMTTLLQEDG